MPLQNYGESDADYRIRVEAWNREHGTGRGEEGSPDANGDGTIDRDEAAAYHRGRGSPTRENAAAVADAEAGYAYRDERTSRSTGAYDPDGYRRSGGRGYGAEGGVGEGGGYWGGGAGGAGGGGAGGDPNTWNDWSSGIPVASWLLGQDSDEAAGRADRMMGLWNDLGNWAPSVNDLTADYDEEGYLGDTTPEGALARENWTEWAEGGMTDADRAMMEESRRSTGRAARADREANMSAMEARGMGGSGAELAGMLAAGEGAADRNASMDSAMMGAIQQRQIGATDDLGAWAGEETGYRRGLEERNVGTRNREEDSRISAEETAYQNRERATAGATNQYSGADRDEDEDEGLAALIGTALSEL